MLNKLNSSKCSEVYLSFFCGKLVLNYVNVSFQSETALIVLWRSGDQGLMYFLFDLKNLALITIKVMLSFVLFYFMLYFFPLQL